MRHETGPDETDETGRGDWAVGEPALRYGPVGQRRFTLLVLCLLGVWVVVDLVSRRELLRAVLGMAVLTALAAVWIRSRRGAQLLVFAEGVVLLRGTERVELRWSQIEEIDVGGERNELRLLTVAGTEIVVAVEGLGPEEGDDLGRELARWREHPGRPPGTASR